MLDQAKNASPPRIPARIFLPISSLHDFSNAAILLLNKRFVNQMRGNRLFYKQKFEAGAARL